MSKATKGYSTKEGKRARFQPPWRRLIAALVWVVVIAWSVYLVVEEISGDLGTFSVVVQILGSIGILFALFLVTRPQKRGVLQVLGVFREDIVPDAKPDESEPSSAAARWTIVTITLALAIGGLFYRLSQDSFLHQSAVFFIGVPTVLSITLALTPKAKSATGMIVKGLTLALLLSGVVFFEGIICILMTAPLFYLVGIVVGIPIDRARRRNQSEGKVYSFVGLALVLLSVEGAVPATSFSQTERIEVSRTLEASAEEVRQALASAPAFDEPLPFYLKLGFPRPVEAVGEGLNVGDRRTIIFGNESPMEPMGESHDHHPLPPSDSGGGSLELEIVRSENGLVVFKPVHDATAFTHWITWGRSLVTWKALDEDTTRVSWTLHFRRQLSPSWYFGPWQRYAGTKAVGYLIDTVATP